MPSRKIIIDTGVLTRFIASENRHPQLVSSVMDLMQRYNVCITVPVAIEYETWLRHVKKQFGARKLKVAIEFIHSIETLPISPEAQFRAVEFSKRYDIGQTPVSDFMTAAVCATEKVEVFTLNRKDFERIQGVKLYTPDNWSAIILEM